MATTGEHGIIIPDPSTAGAVINDIRALALQVEAGLADAEAQVGSPIHRSLAEAQAFEAANPDRVGLWFDTGYVPPVVYEDSFSTAAPDLYATSVDGTPWTKALAAAFGVSDSTMAMQVTGGYATHSSALAAGASLDVAGPTIDIEVDYDLTAGTGANRQVRVFGRGNPLYTTDDRSTMPVQAIVRETGVVQFEPWESSPGVYAQLELGTGAPLTGTLRLSLAGAQARVYVNGSQVGETRTLAGAQLAGTRAGFAVRNTGRVSAFRATAGS